MGEIKSSLAAEATQAQFREDAVRIEPRDPALAEAVEPTASGNAEAEAVDLEVADSAASPEALSHEMQVTLAPNEGTEIKVTLAKGKTVEYTWFTDGGRANFDAHGDSKELEIDYHSYEKGAAERSEGVIEAAFDGHHGWFWRNRTAETFTVTLQTSGEYTEIQRLE